MHHNVRARGDIDGRAWRRSPGGRDDGGAIVPAIADVGRRRARGSRERRGSRGGAAGAIFGDDECTWQGFACYGHELAMSCTPTADAQCSCRVDGEEIATCALGADLVPRTCGDFEVLAGCCTEAFLAALGL